MIVAIVNPVAGHGRSMQVLEQVKGALKDSGSDYQLLYTEFPGHATELAKQAIADGAKRILSVGGDGTLTEIAQALVGTDVVLGAVPAGTGNDYIKSLTLAQPLAELEGVQRKLSKKEKKQQRTMAGIEMALYGEGQKQDVLDVDGSYCLNIASLGFDANVVNEARRFKKRFSGIMAYFVGVVITWLHLKTIRAHLELDDGTVMDTDATLLCFANGKYYGGGFYPVPHADMSDGLMDIMVVYKISRLFLIRFLPSYIKGKHIDLKECEFYRCKSVRVKLTEKHILNIDGELSEADALSISILPQAINIAVQ